MRLKGVWRPIELDGEPAHAFLLPGGDCDRAGEVVECGVTEPSRAFVRSPSVTKLRTRSPASKS